MPIEIFFGGIFNCIKINKLKWYRAYFFEGKSSIIWILFKKLDKKILY